MVRIRAGLVQRRQRAAPHDRRLVPRKALPRQQLAQFQLHQFQQLRVVHHVHFVQVHHDRRHFHLPRQQHVLPRLRHRPVRRRHHQDRPVHLRRPRDHVLDVVAVPRHVHVRVVPLLRLVFHVRDVDRDPALFLFRRVVDRVERAELRHLLEAQHFRDGRRQRRLAVVDVPHRPHIHVRFRAIIMLLRHG